MVVELYKPWWPGPGSNRRPSAFQAELWLTPMCFNWPRQVEGNELDELEHLVRAFGPILAPSISGHLENGHGGPSGRIYRADYLRLWGSPRLSDRCRCRRQVESSTQPCTLSRLPLRARSNGGHTVGLSWADVDRPTRTCRLGRNPARGGAGCPHAVRGLDDSRPDRAPGGARTPP